MQCLLLIKGYFLLIVYPFEYNIYLHLTDDSFQSRSLVCFADVAVCCSFVFFQNFI